MSSFLRSALPLVLVLALSPRRVRGCMLCDPAVVAGLRDLEQNYLPSHMDMDPQVLQTFLSRLEETVRQFSDMPFDKNYRGVIDEPTLSKVSWAFLKELRRIRDSDLRDNFLVKELTWTLHVQKENFARRVREFQRESFCPNKCGLMMQTLIWCYGCEKQVHSCQKSYNCGEQTVRVNENGDMVLDCELSWHKAAEGLTDYRFYRVWPNGSEVLISRGQEPALTKPMVSLEDSGVYRCILGTVRVQSPATVITYHVKVIPEEEEDLESSYSGQWPNLSPRPSTETSVHLNPVVSPSLAPTPTRTMPAGQWTFHGHKPHSTVDREPGREKQSTLTSSSVTRKRKTLAPTTSPSEAEPDPEAAPYLQIDPDWGHEPGWGAKPDWGAEPGSGAKPGWGAEPGWEAEPGSGAKPSRGAAPDLGAAPGWGAAGPGWGAAGPGLGAKPDWGAKPTSGAKATSGAEPTSGAESGLHTGHEDVFVHSGQNAARILNITLIGLVAGGVAAVLGSLALTLYCARRAGLDLGQAGK